MSIPVQIRGVDDVSKEAIDADVHRFTLAGDKPHHGLIVQTERLVRTEPNTQFFLNPTFGAAMNQAITFGAVAVTIHDGGTSSAGDSGTADTDTLNHILETGQNFTSTVAIGSYATSTNTGHVTAVLDADLTCNADVCPLGNEAYTIDPVWVGTAVQGTWNFADSGKITLTEASNLDTALLNAASAARYDWENFTTLTGKVDLDTFTDGVHAIVMGFELNGVAVGNSVDVNDFIDTGDFAEQTFVIPREAFGLVPGNLVNSLRITLLRLGGTKPTFKLDDLQLESTGNAAVFSIDVARGKRFHIYELTFAYADALTGLVTNGTMPGLSYDKILALSALTNGFTILRTSKGKTLFSANIKTIGAHIAAGAILGSEMSDGTNTCITLRVLFVDPLVLSGDPDDRLCIQINDDMSGLLSFTASARGSLEG